MDMRESESGKVKTASLKRSQLRKLIGGKTIAVAPGCYDALGARIIEKAGFSLAYMTGLGVAASMGVPDVGLLTADQVIDRAMCIARSINIPLIADADNGYGGPLNIVQAVRGFEEAGVAGIHLEDQPVPKKCAALPGKTLVETDQMVAKIRLAKEASQDPEFVLIARTDAFMVNGIEDAIRHVRAYEAAGADVTMLMSVSTEDDMHKVTSSLEKPTVVLMAEGIRPMISNQRLEKLGYSMVIYPLSLIMRTVCAQQELIKTLLKEQTTGKELPSLASIEEINDLTRLNNATEWESRYQELLTMSRK